MLLKKQLVLAMFLLIATMSLTVKTASAHVLKIDGDIAVILHVNPNDSPTSSVPTSYFLYFTDLTGRFKVSKCSCQVTIQENGKTIDSQQIADTSPLQSNDPIIFPKPDVYTLTINGQPKQANAFQPFVLSYLIRVAPGPSSTESIPRIGWIALGFVMTSVFGYALVQYYQERKHEKNKRH